VYFSFALFVLDQAAIAEEGTEDLVEGTHDKRAAPGIAI